MLRYKGYAGRVEYDEYSGAFHGEVMDLRDVITFQGKSVEELEQTFRDSVDDYLEFCREQGVVPDRPFSGNLMLRLPPELHRKAYLHSKRDGKSINRWISEKIEEAP